MVIVALRGRVCTKAEKVWTGCKVQVQVLVRAQRKNFWGANSVLFCLVLNLVVGTCHDLLHACSAGA